RMLRSKPIAESTDFRLTASGLQPLAYEFQDGSKRNKRGESATFDWEQKVVMASYKGEATQLPLQTGVVDRNLVPLMMMHQCPKTLTQTQVVSRGSIRNYKFQSLGPETIDTAIGRLDTIKVKQWREGSSRSTISWVSPKHNCLFVRIHQFKEDKQVGRLTIRSVKGL
ncbi:MAG: DUF3108 domain-containing protein, partial [Pseudomonadota bacterium]